MFRNDRRKLWTDLPKLGKMSYEELACFAAVEPILGLQIARHTKYGTPSQIYETMATVMDKYLEYQTDENNKVEPQTEREVRDLIWDNFFQGTNVPWLTARAAVEVTFRLLVRMIARTTVVVMEMRAGSPTPKQREVARDLCD